MSGEGGGRGVGERGGGGGWFKNFFPAAHILKKSENKKKDMRKHLKNNFYVMVLLF